VTPNHLGKQKKLLKKVSYFQMTIGRAVIERNFANGLLVL